MPYSIFISHSAGPDYSGFIEAAAEAMRSLGVRVRVAERNWQFGISLAEKIEDAIREADCVVALVTAGGDQEAYVNQEVGIALEAKRRVVAIAQAGLILKGFREDIAWRTFERVPPQVDVAEFLLSALGLWRV